MKDAIITDSSSKQADKAYVCVEKVKEMNGKCTNSLVVAIPKILNNRYRFITCLVHNSIRIACLILLI